VPNQAAVVMAQRFVSISMASFDHDQGEWGRLLSTVFCCADENGARLHIADTPVETALCPKSVKSGRIGKKERWHC